MLDAGSSDRNDDGVRMNDHDDGVQMSDQERSWSERKFAALSIAASLLEFSSFLVADFLIHYSMVNTAPSPTPGVQGATIYRILAGMWLVLTPMSLVSGALSRSFDSSRRLSNIAIAASAITILFCSLQMMV